jgi:isopentenyl-diphosphate delta-isomerase
MVDVSGTGGTSWAWIEGRRVKEYKEASNLGYLLRDTGIPTDVCLDEAREIRGVQLIAGGGIRSGVDVAKSICMGADYATAAMPFLAAAMESSDAVRVVLQRWKRELKAAMFAAGASNLSELQAMKLTRRSQL